MVKCNICTEKFRQLLAALSANVGSFAFGTTIGWSSPALPSLESLQPFDITPNTKAWIGSIAIIGGAFACPIAGILAEKLGRKRTMLLMTIPFIIGWLLMILANSPFIFLIGRFLTGLAGGTYTVTVPMYISEIADSSIRGRLVGCYQLMMVLGLLFAYVVGSFTNWYHFSIICATIPFILAIFMAFMPESPHFLISRRRIIDARRSLDWLKSTELPTILDHELTDISEGGVRVAAGKPRLQWREFFTAHLLKSTGICFALMFFQQMSGINGVVYYAHTIFAGAGSHINANTGTIVLGIVMVIANVVSTGLVDRAGRRVLLLISQVMITISLVVTGLYFYLKTFGDDYVADIGWLPLVGLIAFISAISLGLSPISWVYMSEVLPQNAKGLTASLTVLFLFSLGFFVTKFFQQYQSLVGDTWSWWTFAIFSGSGVIFTYFLVPETRGKTLEEIEQLF